MTTRNTAKIAIDKPYRAAYTKDTDHRGEICLTAPSERDLPDERLMEIALAEAQSAGLDLSADEITIGEWTDAMLAPPPSKITATDRLFPDVSRKSLAQRYSVSLPTINRVLRRATYN